MQPDTDGRDPARTTTSAPPDAAAKRPVEPPPHPTARPHMPLPPLTHNPAPAFAPPPWHAAQPAAPADPRSARRILAEAGLVRAWGIVMLASVVVVVGLREILLHLSAQLGRLSDLSFYVNDLLPVLIALVGFGATLAWRAARALGWEATPGAPHGHGWPVSREEVRALSVPAVVALAAAATFGLLRFASGFALLSVSPDIFTVYYHFDVWAPRLFALLVIIAALPMITVAGRLVGRHRGANWPAAPGQWQGRTA